MSGTKEEAENKVKEANAKVAQKFGLNEADLTAAEVHTTNSDKANDYGVALAIISKMEQIKTQEQVADEFKKAVNGETSTFTSSLQTAITDLKASAGTNNDYLKNIDTSKLDKVFTVASDTTPPALVTSSTSSDGTKVYLHFDSELSKNTADVNAFTVTVPPRTVTTGPGGRGPVINYPAIQHTISSVAIDGKEVVLTLATPIEKGQTVTVKYKDPTDSNDLLALQDLAGNDAATISETTVVNNVDTKPVIMVGAGQSFDYKENQTEKTIVPVDASKPVKVVLGDGSAAATKFRFTDSQTSISKDGWYSIDSSGKISLTNVGLSAGKASNDFETKIEGGNALVYGVQAGDNAGNWSKSEKITLKVIDVADAPSVKAPVSFTVTEDVAGNLVFAKDAFADVDTTNLTVTLNVKDGHGTLSHDATKANAAGITVTVSGKTLEFKGTTSALNDYFNTAGNLKYQDTENFSGTRTLNIKVSDGALSTSITSNIKITAVNDAPVASSKTARLTAIDEDNTAATGSAVSVLFASNFSDSKDAVTNGSSANTLAGVAVTANTATDAQGVWQWQAKDSETWTATVSQVVVLEGFDLLAGYSGNLANQLTALKNAGIIVA